MTVFAPDICESIVNRFRWTYKRTKNKNENIEFTDNPNELELSVDGKKFKITVKEISEKIE